MEGNRKVEVRATIKSKPATVIEAFVNSRMLQEWWSVDKTLINTTSGGIYTLTWSNEEQGFGYVSTGIIEKYHPEKFLVIGNFVYMNPTIPILGPMTLELYAKENAEGTEFHLRQTGYGEGEDWDWYYEAVTQAWPQVIEGLKNYLEKSTV